VDRENPYVPFRVETCGRKTFGPDGLSRRERQEGDETYPDNEDLDEIGKPPVLTMEDGVSPPLKFEDFKEDIDTRGGYLQGLPKSVACFSKEIEAARCQCGMERQSLEGYIQQEGESGCSTVYI